MSQFKELYRAEQLPVFQNRMFVNPEEARNCLKGDVVLVQDKQTGLIFNNAFRPELMQYDSHYQNEQGVSPLFGAHLRDVAEIMKRHFYGQTLIEVGCGKGYFLEYLRSMSFEITGLDPAYEGDNPGIRKEHFRSELGLRADAIILRHVLEHVQDPVSFLLTLRESNGGAGKIYIEVPCFDWICSHRAWFDIYYEHVNYFRLGDFSRIFGCVHESGCVFGGQYLYVVADLASVQKPACGPADEFEFPADFLGGVDRCVQRLAAASMGQRASAIWGGASKGVIFALFMQRAGVKIDVVIDINPAKQDKYLASTGLGVSAPEDALRQLDPGSDIFVMNSNYLPEIEERSGGRFNVISIDREADLQ